MPIDKHRYICKSKREQAPALQKTNKSRAKMTALKPLVFLALTVLIVVSAGAIQTIQLDLDTRKTGAPISKYIYGQFIEHLGRCIYGGIWAEMLEDRKFYYPITPEYHPYTQLLDTPYPIIGHSPWQIVRGEVSMTEDQPFVGRHSVAMGAGAAIRQNDLGTVKDKQYTGYIWVKAAHGAELTLTLSSGAAKKIRVDGPAFAKYSFQITADSTTDKAGFEIATDQDVVIGTVSLMPADNIHG